MLQCRTGIFPVFNITNCKGNQSVILSVDFTLSHNICAQLRNFLPLNINLCDLTHNVSTMPSLKKEK